MRIQKKQRVIRREILKKLKSVSWKENSESSLNLQYSKLRQLFISLFLLEKQKVEAESDSVEIEPQAEATFDSVEEKEKAVLSQAVLIMKRIYYDPDVKQVFEKDMGSASPSATSSGSSDSPQVEDPLKDITKTSDFFEFIGKILRK